MTKTEGVRFVDFVLSNFVLSTHIHGYGIDRATMPSLLSTIYDQCCRRRHFVGIHCAM